MDSEMSEFRKTINLARNGSEEAFKVLVERYGPHVQRFVRRRIGIELKVKVDEEDLAQMVWASFFNHRSRVVQFEESEAMVKYLVTIAANKVKNELDRYTTAKRDFEREQYVEEPTLNAAAGLDDTPSQHAIRREAIEAILSRCSEREQRIVQMWMEGSNYREIADEVGLDESTVGKVIRKVHKQSEEWGRDDY